MTSLILIKKFQKDLYTLKLFIRNAYEVYTLYTIQWPSEGGTYKLEYQPPEHFIYTFFYSDININIFFTPLKGTLGKSQNIRHPPPWRKS